MQMAREHLRAIRVIGGDTRRARMWMLGLGLNVGEWILLSGYFTLVLTIPCIHALLGHRKRRVRITRFL